MAISSIGVGAGLPLDELLEGLRANENNVLKAIQTRQIDSQSRLSAYGKIKASIEALQTATRDLGNAETFGALKTSVSNGAITASAMPQALAGQYSIQVTMLARSQTLVTAGQPTVAGPIGTGGLITITRADGGIKTLDMAGRATSLTGLVSAINADPDLGVRATIVNDGLDTPYRLLLTTTDTGTNAAINTIEVAGNTDLGTLVAFDRGNPGAGIVEKIESTNAHLQINGVAITSQHNTIDGAISGLTLTLNETTAPDKPAVLTISRDDSVAVKAVNSFVSAYNALQSTIKSLTAYNVDTNSSSALTGDSLARRVQNQVRSALNVANPSGTIRALSQMGITTQVNDGALKVDATKLAAALTDHLGDVQRLFNTDTGIGKQLGTVMDGFLKTGGMISTATDSVNRTMSDLQKQYDTAAARINAKMEVYRRQFTSLDTMVSQMNSVSSYLTQQLSMLSSQGGK